MRKWLIGILALLLFSLIVVWFIYYRPYNKTDLEIGGYTIYKKPQGNCKAYFEPIIYEDEDTVYYTSYSGCNDDDYLYIRDGLQFMSLKDAIEEGLINPSLINGHFRTKDKDDE
jgi:hypothetical protein